MNPSPSSPQAYTKLPGLTLFLLSCRVLASMSLGSGDSAPWGVLVLWPPVSGCGEVVGRLGWVGGVDGGGGARKMGEPLYRRMQHVSGHSSRSLWQLGATASHLTGLAPALLARVTGLSTFIALAGVRVASPSTSVCIQESGKGRGGGGEGEGYAGKGSSETL